MFRAARSGDCEKLESAPVAAIGQVRPRYTPETRLVVHFGRTCLPRRTSRHAATSVPAITLAIL